MDKDRNNGIAAAGGKTALFAECAKLGLSRLKQRVPQLFIHASDTLFELADQAKNNVEQTTFLDGLRAIEAGKAELARAFIESVKTHLERFVKLRADIAALRGDAEAESWEKDELRILDDRDLAATLAVESMSDKAAVRCTRELHALAVRFGHLFSTGPVPIEINPLAPRMICDAFRHACEDFECELEVQHALYQAFERDVMSDIQDFYRELNQFLVKAGVVPDLKYSYATPESESKPKKPEPEFEPELLPELQEDIQVAPAEVPRIDPFDLLRQRLTTSAMSPPPSRRAPEAAGTGGMGAATPVEALIDRLGEIQQQHPGGDQQAAPLTAEQLNEHLAGAPGNGMAAGDRAVVELLAGMFCRFAADEAMPAPFQSALSRMQLPYLRATMASPDLMSSAQSPARQLLDSVAEAGVGWSEQADRRGEMIGKVNSVVESVENRGEVYSETEFSDLLGEFRQFLDKKNRRAELRAKREQEAFEGRQKLRMARQDVAEIIRDQLGSHAGLPKLVRDLVQKAWSHVMVLTLLRHGMESQEWNRVKQTLDELVWSSTFEPTPQNVKRLRTRLPVLAEALADGLRQVGYSEAEIEKLIGNLKSLYRDLIQRTGSDVVVVEASEQGITIRGDDLLAEEGEPGEPIIEDFETLRTAVAEIQDWAQGKWVLFHRDDDTEVRAKLSWISPITGQYLFVDQSGMKAVECTLHQLAGFLANAQVKPIEDNADGLVGYTLNSMAQELDSATLH